MNDLLVCDLGLMPYREAVELQHRLRDQLQEDQSTSPRLLLLEHPPVFTRGRRSTDEEFGFNRRWYEERGIDVVDTDRGGKITYHGPGQLIAYPIMRVTDVIAFVRSIERVIIAALEQIGITAHTREGRDYTGVWVENRKIASIGIHVQRGVTTHGFAINVTNDLTPFTWVTACGLPGVEMTSVERETDGSCGASFKEVVIESFASAFQLEWTPSRYP